MYERYGASEDEWFQWDLGEGLGRDLLPVVCRPRAPIATRSSLQAYGKVPSRYTVQRMVVGMPGWTRHDTTPVDLAQWSQEPDYGICLRTRLVRALDCDLTDHAYADRFRACLRTLGYDFPLRTRANSPKFLLLFRLAGDYGKQTLQTPGGLLEFLANGQQCVVAGTHPSGVRYEWDWTHPIPTFTPEQFHQFMVNVSRWVGADWSDPARSRAIDRDERVVVHDPVVDFLRAKGMVLREAPDGRVFIRCPWSHLHTTQGDVTETCVFPAGTNGFEQCHMDCRHAHCTGRDDWEFLREIGYDQEGFEDIGPPVKRTLDRDGGGISREPFSGEGDIHHSPSPGVGSSLSPSTGDLTGPAIIHHSSAQDRTARNPTLTALDAHLEPVRPTVVSGGDTHPLDYPAFERDKKNGKIKTLLHNVVMALERPDLCGVVLGRDEFKDELVWRPWTRHQPWLPSPDAFQHPKTKPFSDSDYVHLNLGLRALGFGPGDVSPQTFRLALHHVAQQRAFDSAINWITTLPPWDGVPRLETFCSQYLGAEDTPYSRSVARYWWTAHVARIVVPGVQADMAVVLIGPQGTSKTSTLRTMVPHEDHYVELDLQARDEDLCRKMRGKLIGEMAELRGINSKDIESIKAWISRRREEWVPKYLEFSRTFPRRLVLVGTSNQEEFLADETGNRRWLPMLVGPHQDIRRIERDRLQLWAEAYDTYLGEGILWAEAERLARDQHGEFMVYDENEYLIHEWLHAVDSFTGDRPIDREYLLMHDITKGALGVSGEKFNMHLQFRVGRILRKMGFVKFNKRVNGGMCKVWQKGGFHWEDGSTVA